MNLNLISTSVPLSNEDFKKNILKKIKPSGVDKKDGPKYTSF